MSHPALRIFVSYSRHEEDKPLLDAILAALEAHGLCPTWDGQFAPGREFPELIRQGIEHAHLFLAVLTPNSAQRQWPNQELGYALSQGIPILPITRGVTPGQFLSRTQPVDVDRVGLEGLTAALSRDSVSHLVRMHAREGEATYRCAERPIDRARSMALLASRLPTAPKDTRLRQRAIVGTFQIPDLPPRAPDWTLRYGASPRSEEYYEAARAERRELERHVRASGYSAILTPHNHHFPLYSYGREAWQHRFDTLISFLETLPDEETRIAFGRPENRTDNETILGDWFRSQSTTIVFGAGHRQTIFTTHAPSMQPRIRDFDAELDALLRECGTAPSDSRSVAIERLRGAAPRTLEQLGLLTSQASVSSGARVATQPSRLS